MALELQISTQQANQALQQVERSLESLRASLDRVGQSGTAFNNLVNQLRAVSINPAQVQNITQFGSAIRGLSGATEITALASAMRTLSILDFRKLATDFGQFVTQLNSLRVPAAFSQIVSGFNQINNAAQQVNATMQRTATSANQAGGAFNNLRGSIAPVNNLLAAFGVSLGAVGFGNFIQAAYDATSAFQSFEAQMKNLFGGNDVAAQTQFAAQQFQFLRQVARETGRDIQDLMPAYSRWAQNTVRSGMSAQDAAANFYRLNTVFRVFGLTSDQATGAMRAFEQMVSKGRVQMEELRGQLGDRGIPAVAAMAQALGVSTGRLSEMMQAGQVTSAEISKLIDVLYQMAAPGLAGAMQTLDAQMNVFKNTVTELLLVFGQNFFAPFVQGFATLNQALSSDTVRAAIANLASGLGEIASGFTTAISMAVLFGAEVVNAISAVIPTITSVASALFSWIPGFNQLAESGMSIGKAIGFTVGVMVTFITVGAAVWTVNAAFRAVAATIAVLNILTSTWRVVLLGIIAAVAGIAFIIARFRGDAESATTATNALSGALGTVSGTALETANALGNTANEYATMSNAAGNATRNTNTQTDATRRAAQESRDMNAALRNETAERRRVDQSMNDLIRSTNGGTAASQQHRSAIDGVTSAMGGTVAGGGRLNDVLGSNVNSFNAAASAARGYGAAMEWVTATGDRVPVLQRPAVQRGAPTSVAQATQNNSSYTGYNYETGRYDTQSPVAPVYSNDSDKYDGYVTNSPAYDPSEYVTSPSYNDVSSVDPTYKGADESEYDYMQKGGYVGAAVASRFAPSSLWVGAPKFATGGYTPGSGEVPIIAHQGEAVVPLPDGRSIPVSFTGGEFIDSIRAIGVVYKNESDRWIQALEQQTLVLDVIANKINIISTAASTSTSTTGTTSTGTSGGVDLGDRSSFVSDVFASKSIGIGRFFGSGYTAPGALGEFDESGTLRARKMAGASYQHFDSFKSFGIGTPNTSDGGFPAIIHPDEAIIPLPDGRRVPVELREPADKASPLRRATEPTTQISTLQTRGGPVVVNMYINTPDAQSFAASKDQMLTDLQARIERARSRIGFGGSTDDPTIRKV